MTGVDLWAAIAESLAAASIAMRARMLRPHHMAWTEAPAPVWISLSALALCLGMGAESLWFGAHASAKEATVYTALAACGLAMLWNLNRNGRRELVRQEEIARDVETARLAGGESTNYVVGPRE